ncbi:hypothetical protein HZC00_04635 [Candidatus Kaiserbacteria bacterium]|nr:hypothetical protein [Candidatus Kaiserbacteria bacterium]
MRGRYQKEEYEMLGIIPAVLIGISLTPLCRRLGNVRATLVFLIAFIASCVVWNYIHGAGGILDPVFADFLGKSILASLIGATFGIFFL